MRAFLVLGAESTGTRLATKLLIQAGCTGWDGHFQPFDKEPFGDQDPVVWRRSVPHNGRWLDMGTLMSRLTGRDVHVVVTVRDWACTVASQVKSKHAPTKQIARERIEEAYLQIFAELNHHKVPFTILVYESLILGGPQAQFAFVKSLGLDPSMAAIDVTDQNAKWWRRIA